MPLFRCTTRARTVCGDMSTPQSASSDSRRASEADCPAAGSTRTGTPEYGAPIIRPCRHRCRHAQGPGRSRPSRRRTPGHPAPPAPAAPRVPRRTAPGSRAEWQSRQPGTPAERSGIAGTESEVPVPPGDYLDTPRQPTARSRSTVQDGGDRRHLLASQDQSVDMEAHLRQKPVPQRVVHDHIHPSLEAGRHRVVMAACELGLLPRRARADHPFGTPSKRSIDGGVADQLGGSVRVPSDLSSY
jgi:hypothetical protein